MNRDDIIRMALEAGGCQPVGGLSNWDDEWFVMLPIELERFAALVAAAMPTLAVHVGYRYQSPVGGWEYGDHIPAGFDTTKWAHQKIYILQEQS